MRRRLAWALRISGALGLFWAVTLVPSILVFAMRPLGIDSPAVIDFWRWTTRLPGGLFDGIPGPYGKSLTVSVATVAATSVLLVVAGGRSRTLTATLGVGWIVGVMVASNPEGRLMRFVSARGDMTPVLLINLVSLFVISSVSVLALVSASRLLEDATVPAAGLSNKGINLTTRR
jgi:hypothetical protein